MYFSNKRRRSFGKKKQQSQKQIFVGRAKQIELFRQNLQLGPDSDAFQNIFNVYGQGGVGKTTLLQHFKEITKKQKAHCLLLDMEDIRLHAIPEVMAKIADLLKEKDFEFKKFNKLYKEYLQKRSELEADPNRPDSMVDNVASGGLKLGLSVAAELIPGGGIVKDLIPVDSIADKTGKLADFAWRKFGNREDVELALYPLKTLTPVWLEELYECYNERNIAILFDTYETANPQIDEWLVDLLNGKYGDVPDNILLVFGGREKLELVKWGEFSDFITNIPLLPFTPKDAREYLMKKGVQDEKVMESIISVSGCLPVYLALLVDENPNQIDHISRPTEKVVERFLRYINNPIQKKLARLAALPRKLNTDIVKRLLSAEEYVEGLFDWLKTRPFVQNRGGHWSYHPVVRQQIILYNRRESLETWEHIHYQLAAYYQERAKRIEGEDTEKNFADDEWRTLFLEHWYHRLCANYKKELPNYLDFFVQSAISRVDFAELIPYGDVLMQVGEMSGNTEWGKCLEEGIMEVVENDKKYGLQLFLKILKSDYLSDIKNVAYCHNAIGIVYSKQEKKAEATVQFMKAVEIFPAYIRALRNLGYSYKVRNEQKLSLDYYQKAVSYDNNNVKTISDLALAYEYFNEFDKAIECYKRILEVDSDDYFIWNQLGVVYFNAKQDYEQAANCFKKSISIHSDHHFAWYNLGIVYQNYNKDNEESKRCYEKAIEIKPDYHIAWHSLGLIYQNIKEEFNEAIRCYKKTIELEPNYHLAWHNLGVLYHNVKNDYDEAIRYYKKTIEIEPNYPLAWHNLGLILYNVLKSYDEAIECYHKAIECQVDYHLSWFQLGMAYYLIQKKYDVAIDYFKKTIEIEPSYYLAWYGLGDIYCNVKKEYETSLDYYQKALEIEPTYISAWNDMGIAYIGQKGENRYDEAIRCYKRALEIDPDYHLAWYNLANAYKDGKQKYDEAICCYKKSIEIKDDYAPTWYYLGHAYKTVKEDYEKALYCYQKSVEVQPDYFKGWTDLGGIYQVHSKDFDKAIECYKKSIEIQPNQERTYNALGWIYLLQKKKEEAKSVLLAGWKIKEGQVDFFIPMNLGHIFLLQNQPSTAMDWYKRAVGVGKDLELFFKGMESDYRDLEMDKVGILYEDYLKIVKELKK